jgi:6-phosphogluconolactonase
MIHQTLRIDYYWINIKIFFIIVDGVSSGSKGVLKFKNNIHFIKAELGLLEARVEYENTLKKFDKFDIVLLSMGEDGHIASLFPNHIYPEEQMVVVERGSPKSPKERVSMSYQQLNKAHYIFRG